MHSSHYHPATPKDASDPRDLSISDLEDQIAAQMERHPGGSRYADLLIEELECR